MKHLIGRVYPGADELQIFPMRFVVREICRSGRFCFEIFFLAKMG